MNDKIGCIVLSIRDYKENDGLVKVISEQYGCFSLIVKGMKKATSKLAQRLVIGNQVVAYIDYMPTRSIFTLKGCDLISTQKNCQKDLLRIAGVNLLCDVTSHLVQEKAMPYKKSYQTLKQALAYLENGKDIHSVIALTLASMLDMFGVAPEVDGCVMCGNTTIRSLSPKDGGFLCETHAIEEKSSFMNKEDLFRFRILVKGKLEHLDIIEKEYPSTVLDIDILMQFMSLYTPCKDTSYRFYREIALMQ